MTLADFMKQIFYEVIYFPSEPYSDHLWNSIYGSSLEKYCMYMGFFYTALVMH